VRARMLKVTRRREVRRRQRVEMKAKLVDEALNSVRISSKIVARDERDDFLIVFEAGDETLRVVNDPVLPTRCRYETVASFSTRKTY